MASECREDVGVGFIVASGRCWCWQYVTSKSPSLLAARFHIASAVRAGFVSSLWSKQAIFGFSKIVQMI